MSGCYISVVTVLKSTRSQWTVGNGIHMCAQMIALNGARWRISTRYFCYSVQSTGRSIWGPEEG